MRAPLDEIFESLAAALFLMSASERSLVWLESEENQTHELNRSKGASYAIFYASAARSRRVTSNSSESASFPYYTRASHCPFRKDLQENRK